MRLIDKLLSNLYRSFGKDPGAAVALRARHAEIFVWRVQGRQLVAATAAGAPLATVGLNGIDMNGLADALESAGCTIVYRDADLAGIAADTLLDGQGREDQSDGDALRCYTSPLWALLDAYSLALEGVGTTIDSALLQSRMHSARDEWLDYWGGHYGIDRGQRVLLGGGFGSPEDDTAYLKRIVDEVLRRRMNGVAIEDTIFDLTGETVELMEPWRKVFILDESPLSEDHRLHDGHYWTWNVIQPVIRGYSPAISVSEIMKIIERNRPAGVLTASLDWETDAFHVLNDPSATGEQEALIERLAFGYDAPLGEMILDDNTFVLNWAATWDGIHTYHAEDGLGFVAQNQADRTWLEPGTWMDVPWWRARSASASAAVEVLP